MNIFLLTICLLNFCSVITEAFFLLKKAKTEPILFCIKICPLYCHPRSKRDVDMAEVYVDAEDWHEDWPDYQPYYFPPYFCSQKKHPQPTTTTEKPMTTTQEPTYICILCKAKCGYPP